MQPDQHVSCTRPDWTGPEHLLGYEDALLPSDGERRAWHVPEALQLMLRAARDTQHPYLLILDEMNLAHVERYFADVLSGIESREPVLPNLVQDRSGYWRVPQGAPAKLRLPRNLFIVGTVNVDETTYMFSPKVLDRANTIEFRVATDALPVDISRLTRPVRCATASEAELASILAIATDDGWHVERITQGLIEFSGFVRQVHGGLVLHSLEFGHRTYLESLRLAAILSAAGGANGDGLMDTFLLQKVLPRLHGARKKLEPLVRALGALAVDRRAMTESAADFDLLATADKAAVMPGTHAKLLRMMRALQANQFASFSD